MKPLKNFDKWLTVIARAFLSLTFAGGMIGAGAAMVVNLLVGREVLNTDVGGGRGLVVGAILAVASLIVVAILEWKSFRERQTGEGTGDENERNRTQTMTKLIRAE